MKTFIYFVAITALIAGVSAAAAQDTQDSIRVVAPIVIKSAAPNYTSAAMRAHIQGDVLVEAAVSEDGSVGDARVLVSLDSTYGLDEEAIKAVKKCVFTPATLNGKPIATNVTLSVKFALR